MGQRQEKHKRQTDALKERMDFLESLVSDISFRQVDIMINMDCLRESNSEIKSELFYERKKRRHEISDAKTEASRWKLNAILALVLLGLTAACCIVYAAGKETDVPQDGPVVQYLPTDNGRLPGDDVPAAERCYMTPEEVEADENAMIEAALLARAMRMDDVIVTHYCTCAECCGKSDGITASGVKATPGVTVAVDPDVIPLGADVLVDYGDGEIHYMRADDVGGAIKGNRIDVCVGSHDEALKMGRRTATVWWVIPE